MLAACKMNEAERKALVEVFDPKRTNTVNNTPASNKPIEEQNVTHAVDKNSSKTEPQTPKKRGKSSDPSEEGPQTPRKVLFPKKRDSSAPPTPSKRPAPKTPRKRDSSLPAASSKNPKTPNKEQSTSSESLKKSPNPPAPGNQSAPKTPRKRDSSTPTVSKKEPKTPRKKEVLSVGKSSDEKDLATSAENLKNSPKTPTKIKQTPKKTSNSKNAKQSQTPQTQSKANAGKNSPKTPKKVGKLDNNISKNEISPTKKREHSLSVGASKDTKKAKHEDKDSDGIVIVNDPSLIPCKLCPLSFRFKKEYREHLKMHKKETHEKIENTKREIEELKKNITPTKQKDPKPPKTRKKPEKDPIDMPSNDPSVPNNIMIKKSPRLAAKENNWQCGLSDGLGSRCKETFNVRRDLRHHMNFEHRNNRQGS